MRKVGVTGVKGPGGVSTVGLGIAAAAAAAGPATLVEADPSGGSLLAWNDTLVAGRDLYDVAMSRESTGLMADAQRLGELAVLPAWGSPFRLAQALARPRVPWEVLFEGEGTVVVDVGRVSSGSPSLRLLAAMDVVVVVAASEPAPVATTVEWIERGGAVGAGDVGLSPDRLMLVTNEVVGRRRRFSVADRELTSLAAAGSLGHFPHDPVAVDMLRRGVGLSERALRGRRFIEVARWVAGALNEPVGAGR